MISLQINGKQVELERATPLLAYIETLGIDPRAVAVEHNGTILERPAYEGITLDEGDVVEIVRMVGGGYERGPRELTAKASQFAGLSTESQPLLDRRLGFRPFVPRLRA